MTPINPLLKAGAQFAARIGREAVRQATTHGPGVAQGLQSGGRHARQAMNGIGSRMSTMASNPAVQAAASRLQPRSSTALDQLQQLRQSAQTALDSPLAAAIHGSQRASSSVAEFMRAASMFEHSLLFQELAPERLQRGMKIALHGLSELQRFLEAAQNLGSSGNKLFNLVGGAATRPSHTTPLPQAAARPQPQAAVRPQMPPPLAIEAKPAPISLTGARPAEAIAGLRQRGIALKAFQQDIRNYQLHSQPSRAELLDKYKADADLASLIDDRAKFIKFTLALDAAVRVDAKSNEASPSDPDPRTPT